MDKNQKGFALIEGVLVFIIVALLAGIGWYVWNTNKNTNASLNNANAIGSSTLPKITVIKTYEDCIKSKASTTDKKAFPSTCTTINGKKFTDPNPAADWKTYTSKAGKYSLKYPAAWLMDVCDPTATDLTLYLGPTKASSVVCNSGHISQIQVVSTPAVPTANEQKLDSAYYSGQTSKGIKVDGASGFRQSGKLKAASDGASIAPVGSLIVRYFFLLPGRSYIAAYVQSPSGDYSTDVLDEFDYMIQKTLKFTD